MDLAKHPRKNYEKKSQVYKQLLNVTFIRERREHSLCMDKISGWMNKYKQVLVSVPASSRRGKKTVPGGIVRILVLKL